MTAAAVEMLTVESAEKRRTELLNSVGGNEASLRERAADYALDARELVVLDEIDALDYLLGRTPTR